tara:strand:+ start:39812 stop:39946 length:135 start_codon:yes stop_codon:yes gene_type:complete
MIVDKIKFFILYLLFCYRNNIYQKNKKERLKKTVKPIEFLENNL